MKKPLILVVDDEPAQRSAIQAALEEQYWVETAADGQEAWAFVQNVVPRLLVVDLSMPKMGGRELTQKLNEQFGPIRPPVIVLTAHAEAEQVRAMAALGVQSYLLKPISIDRLEEKIRELLSDPSEPKGPERLARARKIAATEPPEKASARIEQLVEQDPMNAELRLTLACACLASGDRVSAKFHAQLALSASGEERADACLLIAYCEAAEGKGQSASLFARKAQIALQDALENGP